MVSYHCSWYTLYSACTCCRSSFQELGSDAGICTQEVYWGGAFGIDNYGRVKEAGFVEEKLNWELLQRSGMALKIVSSWATWGRSFYTQIEQSLDMCSTWEGRYDLGWSSPFQQRTISREGEQIKGLQLPTLSHSEEMSVSTCSTHHSVRNI